MPFLSLPAPTEQFRTPPTDLVSALLQLPTPMRADGVLPAQETRLGMLLTKLANAP